MTLLSGAGRRLAVLLLVASALPIAAGCGGGGDSGDRLSKEEYLQEFQSIGNDLEANFDALIVRDVDTADFDAVADQAEELGAALDELADRVSALRPPEEVEGPHEKLVDGLREFAGWARDLAETVRTAPASELVGVLEEYGLTSGFVPGRVPGATEIQEAVAEFEAAGYGLGERQPDTDTGTTEGQGDAAAGKEGFVANCGSCHTLADAGTTGSIGPDLDAAAPSNDLVVERVTNGRGVMPPFGDTLTQQQIEDVAAYVSSAAGG